MQSTRWNAKNRPHLFLLRKTPVKPGLFYILRFFFALTRTAGGRWLARLCAQDGWGVNFPF